MKKYGVVIETVDSQEELTEDLLAELDVKYRPERVVIEYNGMWKSVILKNEAAGGWGSSKTDDCGRQHISDVFDEFETTVRGNGTGCGTCAV